MSDSLATDFWSRISKGHGPNDCWFVVLKSRFAGGTARLMTDFPYMIKLGGRQYYPHRLAYELVHGPIPQGLIVRHRCANGGCCNPDHHLLGTRQQNSLDQVARRRARIRKGELATYEDFL